MNDLLIIIEREYLNRVRRKSFLLMTLLTPIFLFAAAIIPSLLMDEAVGEKESVLLFGDKEGYYTQALQRNSDFIFVEATDQYLEETPPEKEFSAMLYLPEQLEESPNMAMLVSNYTLSEALKKHINERLSEAASQTKLKRQSPTLAQAWEESQVEVHCQTMKGIQSASENGEDEESAALVSIVAAFLLYIFIFSYGTQVMRSVTEEKSNKIMEVIFLSTRPSHFMAGKIIGIALVGLTQFAIWTILAGVVVHYAAEEATYSETLLEILAFSKSQLLPISTFFLLFFLGGYLLYASLFATIGALSNPGTDTQQFFLPVTIPILFSIYAGIYTACHPNSDLALWCSYIPFTSPIVMLARVCHGISLMEAVLSLAILIATDWLLFRLAGKVYRTTILLRGKKFTYRDLWNFCKQ